MFLSFLRGLGFIAQARVQLKGHFAGPFLRQKPWLVALFLGLILLGCLFQGGCQSKEAPSWEDHDQKLKVVGAEMKEILEKIKKSVGAGHCESDSDCKLAGLGIVTCGNYSDYLIYSARDTKEKKLLPLVIEYKRKSEVFNELSLSVPNCGRSPRPLKCFKGECQIVM